MQNHICLDHRALFFIDIDLQGLLDLGEPSTMPSVTSRGISSKAPIAIQHYIQAMEAYFVQHWIAERAEHSYCDAMDGNPNIAQLNSIDRDISRACQLGEKKSRRTPTTPWSPALLQACRYVEYWKLWLSEHRTGRNYQPQRTTLVHAGMSKHVADRLRTMRPERSIINKVLRAGRKYYTQILRKAASYRCQHLELRAQTEALANDGDKDTILRRIIHAEASQEVFKHLWRALSKDAHSGISCLIVSDNN